MTLCRREGIKPHSYYAWTKEFMEVGKERLTRDAVRDATQQEVQALRRENVELKQLVAELSLEGYRLKKRPSRSLATSQVPTDEHCGKDGVLARVASSSVPKRKALGYAALPIRNIFVEQTGHTPWVAGRPFFIVMAWALLISLLDRHFIQYASKELLQTRSSKAYPTI